MNIKYSRVSFFVVPVLIGLLFGLSSYAQTTATSTDLQALIKQLQAQVQALQQQVNTLQAELGQQASTPAGEIPASSGTAVQASEAIPPELTRSLSRGSSGDDVRKLQEFLSKDKEIYPNGLITGFFGPLTESAVKKWQDKHGIESVGIIGPKTIAKFQDIGKGVIQGLLQQGAGASGVIPPGLLIASGLQGQLAVSTSTVLATTSTQVASTTLVLATTTPSGTIPATPATPAEPPPATGSATAIPATPAVPAQTTTLATTTGTLWVQAIAPSGLVIDKGTTLHLNPPGVNYSARFDYALTSDTKYIRVYLKRPNSSNFVPYTHEAQLPLLDPSQWNYASLSLQRTGASSWYWWPADEFLPNADPSRFGEYKIYVTVINTAGAESVSIETKSIRIYAPPVISSPMDGATVSTKPTITFVTGDSSVGSQYYAAYLYKANGTVAWSNGLASTNFIYPGTALNPSENPHRLLVHSYAAAPNFPQWYSPFSQVTFSVSTSPPAADTTPPSIPTNLTGTAVSSSQINLSWSASTDNVGVTGYRIYRGGTQITAVTSGTSYSDTGLAAATTYSYSLVAYDAAGNVSASSSPISVTTPAVADTTPPTASNLVVTNITSTSVSFSWNTDEPSDSRVEYSSVGNAGWYCVNMEGTSCTFVTLGTTLVTSHSGTLSGLQPNTLYYFRAYSVDAAGNVGGLKSQFTTSPAVSAPPIPNGLTATVGTNGYAVTFTWNDVSGETEYRLWRRPTAGGDWTLITVPSQGYGAPVSFTYQQHPTGSYEYYVAACYSDWTQNIDTCSGQSNVVSVNVTVVSPTAQCATVTLSTNKSVYVQGEFVNWTASCNGYAVHLSTRLYKPDGVQVTYTSTTNYNGFPNPFGAGFSTSNLANGTYILRECINPQCTSGPQASATFTIGSVSTLHLRAQNLATILKSLSSVLQKLQEALR